MGHGRSHLVFMLRNANENKISNYTGNFLFYFLIIGQGWIPSIHPCILIFYTQNILYLWINFQHIADYIFLIKYHSCIRQGSFDLQIASTIIGY